MSSIACTSAVRLRALRDRADFVRDGMKQTLFRSIAQPPHRLRDAARGEWEAAAATLKPSPASVSISITTSVAFQHTPDAVRLHMADPKSSDASVVDNVLLMLWCTTSTTMHPALSDTLTQGTHTFWRSGACRVARRCQAIGSAERTSTNLALQAMQLALRRCLSLARPAPELEPPAVGSR